MEVPLVLKLLLQMIQVWNTKGEEAVENFSIECFLWGSAKQRLRQVKRRSVQKMNKPESVVSQIISSFVESVCKWCRHTVYRGILRRQKAFKGYTMCLRSEGKVSFSYNLNTSVIFYPTIGPSLMELHWISTCFIRLNVRFPNFSHQGSWQTKTKYQRLLTGSIRLELALTPLCSLFLSTLSSLQYSIHRRFYDQKAQHSVLLSRSSSVAFQFCS